MRRELVRPGPVRAVTPLFRAFGDRKPMPPGDRVRPSDFPGSDRAEYRALGMLMPAVPGVALWDGLERLGGPWLAWLAVFPALFVAIHLLVFGLRCRTPAAGFWGWALLFTGWAAWVLVDPGNAVAIVFAWGWLAFLALQGAGAAWLGWRRLMAVGGAAGLRLRMALVVGAHIGMVVLWWRYGWPAGIAAGAVISGFGAWGTLRPDSRLFGPLATRVVGGEPLLTFDDGPDPDDTPAILDALDRHGRRAVFFVIGEKVRAHPELAREIVRRGHELGNHTLTHPQARMWCLGPGRTRWEIEEAQRVIEEVAGVRPRWFRAPVGHRNCFTHPVLAELGLALVGWSRRAFDTVERDVDRLVSRLGDGLGEGEILLVHEATPVARRLVPRLLEVLAGSVAREHDQVVVERRGAPERGDPEIAERAEHPPEVGR